MSKIRAAAGVIRGGNMRVILKQDVENLGRKGDIVNVSAGHGRNYLIPKRLALEVTSSNVKMVEIERQALKKKVEKERLSYQELIRKLNEFRLTFSRKAGEKDMIFGSVSAGDIKEALDKLGFDIEKKKIILEEPIKRLGNYTVQVKVFHDDSADLKIEVLKEELQEEAGESRKKEEEGKEKE
jgi:large subunit ribosomal protein L9